MIKWIKDKIIYFLIGGVALAGTVAVLPEEIPENLLLETDKVNILGETQVIEISDGVEKDIVKYSYKTVEIVDKKDEIVSKRTPHSRTFLLDRDSKETKYQTVFFAGEPQFYKEEENWYQIEYATTTPEAYIEQTVSLKDRLVQKVLADETTFYSTAGDGEVRYRFSTTWSTVRDAVTGTWGGATAAGSNVQAGYSASSGGFYISRAFFPFDTSALGGDTIDSAILSVYVYGSGIYDNTGNDFLNIYTTTQPSTSTFTTADYDLFGTTAQSDTNKDISTTGSGLYYDFTLNATGEGNIDGSGVSKFGVRVGFDVNDTPPTGSGEIENYSQIRNSETAGTDEDPKLVVTHSAGVSRRIILIE